MTHLLVDTDILIDIANNDETAKKRLVDESQTQILCISSITAMELVIGCRNKTEQQALDNFLEQFEVCPLTEKISNQAIELIQTYALSHGMLIPDALIAATAISNNMALLSKNQRDYRFIQNLNLLPYP
ncbi:MAG: type II toxin-antitoxin system VapC family toxin [Symploca sp. SIO2E6]|nr:type II toxin-antitoxin system VapC family toxin [Symploca sp. SIO2E6]